MSGVLLALREVRRAKARFTLLAAAVGLLSFLIVFQQALLGQLVEEFVGGVRQQSADVLVYGEQARTNLLASVVPADALDAVAGVDGVAGAGPLGVAASTIRVSGQLADATLVGYRLGAPGAPRQIAEGRLPERPGEVVVSSGGDGDDLAIGDTVEVLPGGERLAVVGLAPDASLNVTTTVYLDVETYREVRRSQNPDAGAIPDSAVAVRVEAGAPPAAVADAITGAVPGVEALDRDRAVARTPGVDAINQSLTLVVGLTYTVIVLVTGFFFLILTVQKAPSLTLLRALGAPPASLVVTVLSQSLVVIVAGFALGTVLSRLALTAPPFLGATLEAGQVLTTLAVLLVLGGVASWASIRRVLRIDPHEATVPAGAIR